ncbi:MAG: DMT family transporter [Thiobacillus sp.]|nr:DMT family transporter [Thiobacillus sp.]
MLVAGLCFALMSGVVKQSAHWFTGVELVFYRSVFAFLLIAVPMLGRHHLAGVGVLTGEHLGLHLRRGLVGFLALATFFHALVHLPMSMAVTLNYASPLFLALLMPWQLKEQPSLLQYVSVALGFLGVSLLLHPWDAPAGDLEAGLVGLFSGVMAAFAYIHVRKLGRLHEPEWRTVFWFSAVCVVGAGALATATGWHDLHVENLPWLMLLGLLATMGQLAMTRAYRTGHTALVASFAFSTVVFSALLETWFFEENMPINAWFGMAVIVAAGIWAAQLSLGDRK